MCPMTGAHWVTEEAMKKQHTLDHRCRSKKILGGAKDFYPNFPKLARKIMQRKLTPR